MNYEEMSDFEINKLVVDKHLHMFVNESKSRGRLDSDVWVFDSEGLPRNTNYNPCNNPNDAFPIIVENKISTSPTGDSWICGSSVFGTQTINKNPLRAACICFLKMQSLK